jgi:lactate permease
MGELGFEATLISCGIFPAFGALAAVMATESGERRRAAFHGLALGSALSGCLVVLNWVGIVELAGVLAGVITTFVCLLVFRKSRAIAMPPWEAIAPYTILLGLVFIIRMMPLIGIQLSAFAFKGGGVTFAPLTSPGIALAVTVLIISRGKLSAKTARNALLRLYKPVLALGGFTLMAQLMVASGMIFEVGNALPTSNVYELTALSPLLGIVSGYLTGSNVGGNALMMTMQSTVGRGVGMPLLFAAIQNSSAGHAVFASMPIILLVLAIAGGPRKGEESDLVRFGLLMLALVATITVLTSMALLVFCL